MVDMSELIADLNKVDKHFGLPDGATASIIAHHRTEHLDALNLKLVKIGVIVGRDATVIKELRPRWARLMQELGVSRAWWLDGDPSIAKVDEDIKKL